MRMVFIGSKRFFLLKAVFFYRPNVFPSSYSLKFSLAVVWFQNLLNSNTGCNKLRYENMRKIQEMAWVKIPQPWSIFSQSSYILILLCCYIIILLNFETFLNFFFFDKKISIWFATMGPGFEYLIKIMTIEIFFLFFFGKKGECVAGCTQLKTL